MYWDQHLFSYDTEFCMQKSFPPGELKMFTIFVVSFLKNFFFVFFSVCESTLGFTREKIPQLKTDHKKLHVIPF